MKSDRVTVTIVATSSGIAVLAIAAAVIDIGQPLQFLATLGGVLLGPGALAYRLATRSNWTQCLMVGLALNAAAVMLLGLTTVAIHFWHPKVELIIPLITCVLAIALYRGDRRQVSYYAPPRARNDAR